jgi:hypothetical protein
MDLQADVSIRHAIHPEPASMRVKRIPYIDARLWRHYHISSCWGAAHNGACCWRHGAREARAQSRRTCIGVQRIKRKNFFLKKEAKTFTTLGAPGPSARLKKQKFFGSFSQKRTACFLCPLPFALS